MSPSYCAMSSTSDTRIRYTKLSNAKRSCANEPREGQISRGTEPSLFALRRFVEKGRMPDSKVMKFMSNDCTAGLFWLEIFSGDRDIYHAAYFDPFPRSVKTCK